MRKKVLFLCTGNSCRSQMAEGLVNEFYGTEWQAFSAGTRPSGYVHPLAVKAMGELNIDISGNESTHTDALKGLSFEKVVTVCDNAAQDCPIWLGEGQVTHMPFPDPADATGSEADKMAVFQQVRDEIRAHLEGLLNAS